MSLLSSCCFSAQHFKGKYQSVEAHHQQYLQTGGEVNPDKLTGKISTNLT